MPNPLQDHASELVAKTATFGGSMTAVSGSAWTFLGNNAEAIGAVCAIGGFLVAFAGYRWLAKHKRIEIEIATARLEAMKRDRGE